MDYVNNTLDIKEINNKKENKEMYKVKNLNRRAGLQLQSAIENWVESRDHITVVSVNVWCDKEWYYATIVYREVQYVG